MKVVFVDTKFLAHNIESSQIENKNLDEIEEIVGCEKNLLGIHTPLFIRSLERNEDPLSLFPELLVEKKYVKYEHPTVYLVQMDPKDGEGIYYFNVQIESVKNLSIPNFYVPFNYDEFSEKSSDDIINQIKTVFTFDAISPELYVGDTKCADLKGKDIFDNIINKKQQLIMKCELSDAADKTVFMRQQVLAEVISTEKTYINDLKTISDFWKPNLEELKIITEEESRLIFKDVSIITSYQVTFLSELEARGTEFSAQIADVFIMFSHFFKSSKLYISNYQNVVKLLSEKENREKFTEIIDNLAQEKGGRDLASFLITPVQRMPRYILFLRELLKYTPKFHPDRELLEFSYEEIEKVTREIDQSSELAKRQQKLYRIQTSLNSSGISILEATRILEQKFVVKLLHYPKYDESKSKTKFYLFNDLIVVTKKSGKRTAIFYSHLNDVSYIRNLPTFDAVTFCTNLPHLPKKSSLQEFISIRFESPQERDDLLKTISEKLPVSEEDLYFKDIAMSYLPPILSGHKTAFIDNIIYSFGGYNAPKDVVAFDISEGTINYQNALIPTLEGHSVAAIGEDVYICGGQTNGRYREETWKWNPADQTDAENSENENKRKSKSTLVAKNGFSARVNQSMSVWEDTLIVFGGKGGMLSSCYNNVATLDTKNASDGWHVYNDLKNSPQSRYGHTSVVYEDKMYIYGGRNEKTTFSDIQVLNLSNMEWEESPQLTGDELPPRAFHQSVVFEGRPIMLTIGGNDDTSVAHLVDLEKFSVRSVKVSGNIPPCLSNFSLTLTEKGDLIIIGGKSKDRPTNLVQLLSVPASEKEVSKPLTGLGKEVRKRMNSVKCIPVPVENKEDLQYNLESQKQLQEQDIDVENEYEYDHEDDAKKEDENNTEIQQEASSAQSVQKHASQSELAHLQQNAEKQPDAKKETTEKIRRSHRSKIRILSVSKNDFSLPSFVNLSLIFFPALAVLFLAIGGVSKLSIFVTAICIALTALDYVYRNMLIKKKERLLENALCNEIKDNDGYVNKDAFLLKYNVSPPVLEAFIEKNKQAKKFALTSKTVNEITFDAIELAK